MYFIRTSANGVDVMGGGGRGGEAAWHRSFVGPKTGEITIPSPEKGSG